VRRKWFGLRRQWYVYIAGALLYTSAVALGNFWLFLVGTVIIFIAVGIGEVDRKAERRAVATAPLAVGDGCTVSWRPSVRRGGPARGAEGGSAVRPHPVACPMAVGRKHGLDGMLRVRGQDGYRRAATSWRIRRSHPGRDRHRSSSRHPSRQGVCHSHANCPRLSAFRWPTCSGLLHPHRPLTDGEGATPALGRDSGLSRRRTTARRNGEICKAAAQWTCQPSSPLSGRPKAS
jgi:hypothetical protein